MSSGSTIRLADTSPEGFRLPSEPMEGFCLLRIAPAGGCLDNLIELTARKITLGRDPDCDIPTPDEFSSRHHATIAEDSGEYWLIDRESRNGTYINDERVGRRRLMPGDQLRVGKHVFKFLPSGHPEATYHRKVCEQITSDALTNIANRRCFEENLARELSRCARHKRPLGLLLVDVDHFKQVNDSYGHLAGDECLKEFCDRVRQLIRETDLFARIGGDEFAIVLSETLSADCRRVAERVRKSVESSVFGQNDGLGIDISVSIGIAHVQNAVGMSMHDLLMEADARLYTAKDGGRNCICGPNVPAEAIPLTRDMPVISIRESIE